MKRVGYWMSEKKRKKLDFEEHRELFRNAGLNLVRIDLSLPMEDQGPFDLILHKFVDIFVLADKGHEPSQRALQDIEAYLKRHPECIVLDPLDSLRTVLDRYTQYKKVVHSDVMADCRCMIPSFVELTTNNIQENKEKLAHAGVTFPLVCKPLVAHGSNFAHQMSIIFNEENLKDVRPPCVAQSFINHNAILYKMYIVGCKQFIAQRPSLRNLYPGDYPTIFFDTQQVSKADSDHPLNAVDYATMEDQPVKPDWVYLDKLGQKVREAMGLDLLGFDVIIDSRTNQYGIIDINFFPGFETIDCFFPTLVDHVAKVLEARENGGLVNGRLLASPQGDSKGATSILNERNQKKRAPSASEANTDKKPHLGTTYPVIDISPQKQPPASKDLCFLADNLTVGDGDIVNKFITEVPTLPSSVSRKEDLCLYQSFTGSELSEKHKF